jgi:hypothetical protein
VGIVSSFAALSEMAVGGDAMTQIYPIVPILPFTKRDRAMSKLIAGMEINEKSIELEANHLAEALWTDSSSGFVVAAAINLLTRAFATQYQINGEKIEKIQ